MARTRMDCPHCDASLRIVMDADGERSAWCEDCEREISVRGSRNSPRHDRELDQPSNNTALFWILAISGVVLLLFGVGLFVLMSSLLLKPAPPPMPQFQIAPPRPAPTPTPKPPPLEIKPKPTPIVPVAPPEPKPSDNPVSAKPSNSLRYDESSPFDLPEASKYDSSMLPRSGMSRFGQSTTSWVYVPTEPVKQGFVAKMPHVARESQGRNYTTFRASENGTHYIVRVYDLKDGTRIDRRELESGVYADDHVSFFFPAKIDDRDGYAASRGTRGTKYCAYVQVKSKLYMFVVVSSNPFDYGLRDNAVSEFISSIRFDDEALRTTPVAPPRPLVPPPPKKEFQSFDQVAVLQDQIVTIDSPNNSLNIIYRHDSPNRDRPNGEPSRSTAISKGQIHSLDNLKPIQNLRFDHALYDLQSTPQGELLSIECQKLFDGCAFYLHQHDPKEITQSTRTRIPDNAFFTLGNRMERLPCYNAATEMFTIVSSMSKSELHPEVKGVESTNVLRQVHLQRGETKPPIEFDGLIRQYCVSPDGTWIVVEVDENTRVDTIGSMREPIEPNSEKKRYLAVCDTVSFRVVKTVPLPKVLTELAITFDKPDTALLVLGVAGETIDITKPIDLKTLHSNGTIDDIELREWEPGQFRLNGIKTAPFRAIRLPENDGWVIGSISPFTHYLRVKIENGTATVVEKSRLCPRENPFHVDLTLLPDNKRIFFHNGSIIPLDVFFSKLKQ